MNDVEFRAAQLVGLSYPKRQIELIVMPYETETEIYDGRRTFIEIVSRGAFTGVEQRTHQIKVNADHQVNVANTIGKTLALHPGRPDGLIAEIKIVRGPLGDHALELADEGCLGASAGFSLLRDKHRRVYSDAEVWETSSRRRLNKLRLEHIALTPDPAYETKVLTVRDTSVDLTVVAKPNLERLEIELLKEQYAEIDRRYAVNQH